MKAEIAIRRQLLDMTTRDTLAFGVLTVRLFKSRHTVRWQIDSAGVKQTYRYPRYTDSETVNEILWEITTYILRNRDGWPARYCPHCGSPVRRAGRAKYCSTVCQIADGNLRQKQRRLERTA